MFIDLLSNLGLLTFGAFALLYFSERFSVERNPVFFEIGIGISFGILCALVIYFPVVLPFGNTIDTRAAPILLAGVFGGGWAALITAAFGIVARLETGGDYAFAGAISVLIYAGVGIAVRFSWYDRNRRAGRPFRGLHYLALAIVGTISVVPTFFMGPDPSLGPAILAKVWPTFILGNVIGVVILGAACTRVLNVIQERDQNFRTLNTFTLANAAAGVGTWDLELPNGPLTWDERMFQIYGKDPKSFTHEYSFFRDSVHPDDIGEVERRFFRAVRNNEDFAMQFRIVLPNGDVRHVSARAKQYDSLGRNKQKMIGVNWDVTEEVDAQESLNLRSQAIDSASQGLVIARNVPGYPIVSANPAFFGITGFSEAEVLGGNLSCLQGEETDRNVIARMVKAMREGRVFSDVITNYRKDGTFFYNQMTIAPVYGSKGEITHFVGTSHDITESRVLAKERQKLKDRLDTILATAPDALITCDRERRIVNFNSAAEELFGWSAKEAIGADVNKLVPAHFREEHVGLQDTYLNDPSARPGPMTPLRIVNARKKSGEEFPALITLGRFEIDGVPEVTVIAHDMTEVVKVNKALETVTEQLSEQLARAEDANVAKTRFLANMSHELRTPLNAIIGFSEAMREQTFGPLSDTYCAYADDIANSGHHLLSLINDILDVARLEHDAIEMNFEQISPREAIYRALRAIRPLVTEKGLKLRAMAPRELPDISLDRRSVQQCLLNILSNAIRHTPPNGRIFVGAEEVDDKISMYVTDTGEGITEEKLCRIGRPFEPVTMRDSHVSENRGTGLGLAITKSLTEAMGGSFELTSKVGKGTTVRLTFAKDVSARPMPNKEIDQGDKLVALDPPIASDR